MGWMDLFQNTTTPRAHGTHGYTYTLTPGLSAYLDRLKHLGSPNAPRIQLRFRPPGPPVATMVGPNGPKVKIVKKRICARAEWVGRGFVIVSVYVVCTNTVKNIIVGMLLMREEHQVTRLGTSS